MSDFPKEFEDLLRDSTRAYACLATLMPDGSPQVTPLWFTWDGTHIIINTMKGRIKDRNMRRDHRVALAIFDPRDLGRYLQVRGEVVEITETGADEMINRLAIKYTGSGWGGGPGIRVTYRILPRWSK